VTNALMVVNGDRNEDAAVVVSCVTVVSCGLRSDYFVVAVV
jgi:hypothetical protein